MICHFWSLSPAPSGRPMAGGAVTATKQLHSFIVLVFTVTGNARQESGNSTEEAPPARLQRETYERERRLIPYMTYYITQNPTSTNVEARQNIFIPITSPRENIFHFETVPKTPLANIHNDNPQRLEVLPKSAVRISNPQYYSPTIQAGHYKDKEDGVLPQIYRLEPGVIGPRIQTQVLSPQRLPSESQPLQAIKVNPVPVEQKANAPQLIKIVPFLTKFVLDDRSPKSFTLSQPQSGYSTEKLQTLIAGPVPASVFRNDNSFQENKVHIGHVPQGHPQLRLVGPISTASRPDSSAYTTVKIATTPSSLINGRPFKVESNVDQVSIAHLNAHAQAEYEGEPVPSTASRFTGGKYVTVTPGLPQTYYAPKVNDYHSKESHDLVYTQNLKQIPRLRVPQEEKIRFVASVTPIPVNNDLDNTQGDGKTEKIYDKQPLSSIFSLLKETNKLPSNLTPENIDAGIQTLALILERLQQQAKYQQSHKVTPQVSSNPEPSVTAATQDRQNPRKIHSFPEKSGTSTPGRPGIDYPIYSSIPQTNFDCSTQRYKGFFGDPDTNCQVWHYCDLNGGQASFLCPNGTIFSQVALTCDWWFNVKCASTSQLYVLNERLYKYILPFSPSFPEDYSGPVVDTYLAAKFKEMEVKSKLKALKAQSNATTTAKPEITTEGFAEGPTELAEEFKPLSTEE